MMVKKEIQLALIYALPISDEFRLGVCMLFSVLVLTFQPYIQHRNDHAK